MISNQYPPYFRGGDAIACRRLSEALVKEGYKISVIFDPYSYKLITKSKEDCHIRNYIQNGVEIHPLYSGPLNFGYSYSGLQKENKRLTKLLHTLNPDLIHFHNFSAFGWGALRSAKEIGKPILLTLHDYWIACPRRKLTFNECNDNCISCQIKDKKPPSIKRQDYLKYVNAVICVSKNMVIDLKKKYPNLKYFIIPNGIDENMFYHANQTELKEYQTKYLLNDHFVLLFIGILQKQKGIYELIKTIKLLESGIKTILIGEDKISLDSIIKENNLESSILYLGKLEDGSKQLSMAYQVSNCFVLPSYMENCPYSLIEAMCFGLPIISSNIGGIPEMITNNGILIKPGNIKELRQAIDKLYKNPILQDTFSRESRARFLTNYTLDENIKKHISLFNQFHSNGVDN
jgi:glycosyltransferase involved in cell wall biosynthesis